MTVELEGRKVRSGDKDRREMWAQIVRIVWCAIQFHVVFTFHVICIAHRDEDYKLIVSQFYSWKSQQQSGLISSPSAPSLVRVLRILFLHFEVQIDFSVGGALVSKLDNLAGCNRTQRVLWRADSIPRPGFAAQGCNVVSWTGYACDDSYPWRVF